MESFKVRKIVYDALERAGKKALKKVENDQFYTKDETRRNIVECGIYMLMGMLIDELDQVEIDYLKESVDVKNTRV